MAVNLSAPDPKTIFPVAGGEVRTTVGFFVALWQV